MYKGFFFTNGYLDPFLTLLTVDFVLFIVDMPLILLYSSSCRLSCLLYCLRGKGADFGGENMFNQNVFHLTVICKLLGKAEFTCLLFSLISNLSLKSTKTLIKNLPNFIKEALYVIKFILHCLVYKI